MAKEVAAPSEVKVEKQGKFDKYEVENALRTLREAAKVKKNSALMKEVAKLAKEESEALADLPEVEEEDEAPSSLAELRGKINKKHEKDE